MVFEQMIVLALLGLAIGLFIWDHWRYDLVALFILLLSVLTGVVPAEETFSGFSDPAVTTVACVLVMSAAISRSGFVDWVTRLLGRYAENPSLTIIVMVALVMIMSAFMNNVGALAVFLPVALSVARKAGRPASQLLMPLSFGSLLGGLVTLIGTPPNILISNFRKEITGEPFSMFDFAPVGAGICVVGILYLSVGWRLIPRGRSGRSLPENSFSIEDYISEVVVPGESNFIGKTIGEIEREFEGGLTVAGMVRKGQRRLVPSHRIMVQEGDTLIVESAPAALKKLVDNGRLSLAGSKEIGSKSLTSDDVGVVEAVITPNSDMIGLTPRALSLRMHFGVNLLAVQQSANRRWDRLSDIILHQGDVIILQGNLDTMPETLRELGCLPLANRNLLLGRKKPAFLSVILMAAAVALTAAGVLPVAIAFLSAAVIVGLLRILRLREIYESIDAPTIVLLAAMIPVTKALQDTGGAELISAQIAFFADGASPTTVLAWILIGSMMLTPFLNNAATVLLMAPIAAATAVKLGLNVDPFLMAVAIGASCDFLTPIGHQSNTLVMGPGGYKFGDYWRLGLPLSFIVIITAVPLIQLVWPLH